jgi:preprotein translocase subunit YajC
MPNNLLPLLYLFLIIAAFYLLVIRPQRSRARRTAAMQSQLGPGDEVMLTSGIFGTIVAVDDQIAFITIANGIEIKVDRRAVGRTTHLRELSEPEQHEDSREVITDGVDDDVVGPADSRGRSLADDDPEGTS